MGIPPGADCQVGDEVDDLSAQRPFVLRDLQGINETRPLMATGDLRTQGTSKSCWMRSKRPSFTWQGLKVDTVRSDTPLSTVATIRLLTSDYASARGCSAFFMLLPSLFKT